MRRTILIIVCGAVPALPLTVLAALVVWGGTSLLFDRPAQGLLLLTWGLAGICGSASLWLAAFRRMNAVVVSGLVIGCFAIAPVTYIALRAGTPDEWIWVASAISPPATAVALLIDVARRRSQTGTARLN